MQIGTEVEGPGGAQNFRDQGLRQQGGCPFRSAVCPSAEIEAKRPTYDGVQKMDLTPMAEADWFRLDQDYPFLMREKAKLIAQSPNLVYASNPESLTGGRELLELVVDWLLKYQPDKFSIERGLIYNATLDRRISVAPVVNHPLLVAAQLVAEDLVLLTQDSDRKYRMSAACVCFPSAWSISEKLGRSVWEIHEPVNSLNKNIGLKIDELLLNLKPDKPLTRISFLINFDPLLSQIPETMSAAEKFPRPNLTPETIGSTLWLRNERESLRKLPKSGDIVFTLKT